MSPVSKKPDRVYYWEGKDRERAAFFAHDRAFKYLFSVVEFSRRRLSNKWSKVEVIPSLDQIPPHYRSRVPVTLLVNWEFPSKFHSCSRKFVSGSDPRDPLFRTLFPLLHASRAQVLYLASRRATLCLSRNTIRVV